MILSRSLLRRHSVLPGFDLALGFSLLYIGLIVLIRTVLSMSIQIEIDGVLPWRRALLTSGGQVLGEQIARDRAASRDAR